MKAVTVSLYANDRLPQLIFLRIPRLVTVTSEHNVSVKKLPSFDWHLMTLDACTSSHQTIYKHSLSLFYILTGGLTLQRLSPVALPSTHRYNHVLHVYQGCIRLEN
jgi:hypothetical protein